MSVPRGQMVTINGQAYMVVDEPQKRVSTGSCWNKFFVNRNGVIAMSLRDSTIILSILLTGSLLTMLGIACKQGKYRCDLLEGEFPMVSDILCLPFFDRLWCIGTTVFCWGVMQVNVRAIYQVFHGIITPRQNDVMATFGILCIISFPLIGYFDENDYWVIHIILAAIFFGATTIYANRLAHYLHKHKSAFREEYQGKIRMLYIIGNIMIGNLIVLAISWPLGWFPALFEWILAVLYINFFTFASFMNDYYQSIHQVTDYIKDGEDEMKTIVA